MSAEIERNLISQRTKGVKPGRSKGRKYSKYKLSGKDLKIKELLSKGLKKTEIARMMNVNRNTLNVYIKKQGISISLKCKNSFDDDINK